MATYLLKKSYQLKSLKETAFKDLWGDHGIFTTMWIFGKPAKILFFDNHIKNLVKSLKDYGIIKRSIKKDILKLINKNLSKNKKYNHLLRIALNKKFISISLRKRLTPKLNFNLKLINLKREKPEYKNLKYKKILSYLLKMDNSKSDIALISNKKILETGTSNLLFIKNNKVFTPKKDYYEGTTFKFFKHKIKKIIRRSGVEYVHEKEQGDTVEKVIEKAGDDKIIVMRSSDMSPLKRYFKGSIPLSIMNRCNVPILIVK